MEDDDLLEVEPDLLADGETGLNNEFKFVPTIGVEVVAKGNFPFDGVLILVVILLLLSYEN